MRKNIAEAHRYNLIKKWILTEEDLETNSYPMPTSTIGIARINNDKAKLVPEDRKIRQCSRCPKEYSVDDDGIPLVREACIYHPRRCYKTRGNLDIEIYHTNFSTSVNNSPSSNFFLGCM